MTSTAATTNSNNEAPLGSRIVFDGTKCFFAPLEDYSHCPAFEIPSYLCEDAPVSEDEEQSTDSFEAVKLAVPTFDTRAYLSSFWLKSKRERSDLKPFEEPVVEEEEKEEEEPDKFEKVSFAETATVIIYDEHHYVEHREVPQIPASQLKRAICSTTNPNKYEEMFLMSNPQICAKVTKEGLCEEDEQRPDDHNEALYRFAQRMAEYDEEDDEEEDEEELQKYIHRMQAIQRYNTALQEEENAETMQNIRLE